MKLRHLPLVTALLPACLPVQAEPVAPAASGAFSLPEVSGAAFVGERLLITADDVDEGDSSKTKSHMIDLLDGDAAARLAQGGEILTRSLAPAILKLIANTELTDLEDIASTPGGPLYLITSHSLNKNGKGKDKKPERFHLLRLTFTPEGQPDAASLSSTDLLALLPKDLRPSLKLKPGEITEGVYTPGFNIEGLAWAPGKSKTGDLLIGLRSPLTAGKTATLLRLENADSPETATLVPEAGLDLGGLGIRGLCWDPGRKGHWILAGNAPDPETNSPPISQKWAIYFRDKAAKLERRLKSEDLSTQPPPALNPETITLLPAAPGGTLLLISDDGKDHPSRFLTIAISALRPK